MTLKRARDPNESGNGTELAAANSEPPRKITKPSPSSLNAPETSQGEQNPDLTSLLDLTSLTAHSDLSRRFDQIASTLLHDYRIHLMHEDAEYEFEILELEFYLYKTSSHEDPFTHGADEQRRSGQWYFHRAHRRSTDASSSSKHTPAGGYRGGTRKGLDVTFGPTLPATTSPYFSSTSPPTQTETETETRGGILIRTIRQTSPPAPSSTLISGPSLLVDHILRLTYSSSVADLVNTKWNGDISAFPPSSSSSPSRPSRMYLNRVRTDTPDTPKPQIHRSPRIGLDLSSPETTDSPTHPRIVYISQPYRYFTHPHLLTANGRVQTFLGIYRECLQIPHILEDRALLINEIAQSTGLKSITVSKYIEEYRTGSANRKIKSHIGLSGKGASSSATTYLRMMGAVDTLTSESEA